MTETDYIGQSLVEIARFAQAHGVHVWIVVHPTKLFKEPGPDGKPSQYPIVTPNMIAGSSNWWNMADNILSLWRDIGNDDDPKVQIHTQKVRFDENGRMGHMAELTYHKATKRYSE